MKNNLIFLTVITIMFLPGCERSTDPNNTAGKITAKEIINDVLQNARVDFAPDARLAAIYGWNVDLYGKVDLLRTDNAFVYVVQSSTLQTNEFYVPLFASGPVRSPINFTTMQSLVKDSTANNLIGRMFNRLATLSIDPAANYNDSPAVIDTALVNGGNAFIVQNPEVKIDMFLVPSKSIDTTLTLNNSADWIVNFYSADKSLVLWISSTGVVKKISGG